jgi:hypothetical protein
VHENSIAMQIERGQNQSLSLLEYAKNNPSTPRVLIDIDTEQIQYMR